MHNNISLSIDDNVFWVALWSIIVLGLLVLIGMILSYAVKQGNITNDMLQHAGAPIEMCMILHRNGQSYDMDKCLHLNLTK